ncbi:MAG: 4-(cytidine 5'-diphospho)-2-C-methyl-D-erythritol kinase [Bacteroidetes bacterium]|nr:MAG: 4-(cytidine 5'-diphospho)-2-C-methyl-D-erythritol kinase [Bacteroidota bacterium]PIE88496.1 MAG: 4-(cytidine 5'-diphospho)-2-C-methyl-D-erythritol kinase [Bacteroidota bacterium]
MIVFPNAKINLGLKILHCREDGYHNIETLFLPIGLKDILEIVPAAGDEISLTVTGLSVGGALEENLVYRAARLMQKSYGTPGVRMHLHKRIPLGAGLGGGSSDASFALKLINRIFALGQDEEALKVHAASLGSDCPFFLVNRPMLGTGTGGVLTPVELPALDTLKVMVVKPAIHIATAEAYAGVSPDAAAVPLMSLVKTPPSQWRELFTNDFEPHLFATYPQLGVIKEKLYRQGAVYASMSGSGAALYGFFHHLPDHPEDLFPDCFVWQAERVL